MTFVKDALGESFEKLQRKENEEVYEEKLRLLQSEQERKQIKDYFETIKQSQKER